MFIVQKSLTNIYLAAVSTDQPPCWLKGPVPKSRSSQASTLEIWGRFSPRMLALSQSSVVVNPGGSLDGVRHCLTSTPPPPHTILPLRRRFGVLRTCKILSAQRTCIDVESWADRGVANARSNPGCVQLMQEVTRRKSVYFLLDSPQSSPKGVAGWYLALYLK